jgi:hypothetical protein
VGELVVERDGFKANYSEQGIFRPFYEIVDVFLEM